MKKPPQGSILDRKENMESFLVVEQEPRNWKDGVGVREMLPGNQLGPLRIFTQSDWKVCARRYLLRAPSQTG